MDHVIGRLPALKVDTAPRDSNGLLHPPDMITNIPDTLSPPLNHVFVDFENVSSIDFSIIGSKPISITVFIGAHQTRLDASLVEKMMEHAASVKLIRLTTPGKNSLDFTLAYYIGRSVVTDPTGYFHIVSKDTGFDPLIEHLRSRHVRAYRHDSFATLKFSGSKPPSDLPKDAFNRALEHLRRNSSNRPKRKKTLISHLRGLCGNGTGEKEALALIDSLTKAGHLSINDKDAVTYKV